MVVNVGLIGSSRSIGQVEQLFEEMRTRILRSGDPERWNPPFPGIGPDSPFKFSISLQKRWREVITGQETRIIKETDNRQTRYEKTLQFIENKVRLLYQRETPPDVIVVALPEEVKDACIPPHQKAGKIQSQTSDLRSRVKLAGMQEKIPTQLIRPKTLAGGADVQDRAEVAWNIAVAIRYKASRGHPWKLAHLESDTCYAGISFYVERGQKRKTKASMAQVFLETGESFILRGDPVDNKESGPGNNHLSESDAEDLVDSIIEQYARIKGHHPERLVLHKTSNYWSDEREGFLRAAERVGVRKLDFITIRERSPVRMFTEGEYPVLRGTMLSSPNQKEHYLYTKGFIPELSTYPGLRVPKPITIKPDESVCDTPIQEITEEILAFTKLDWNTSDFCKKLPVTIQVSRAVGKILSESKARDLAVDPHYYYYM